MNRLSNTWSLAKISWGVLKKDRDLMWLPVLSFLASAAVLAVTIVIVVMDSVVGSSGVEDEVGAVSVVFSVLALLLLGIITVFFNGALVAAAHERLSGGAPTVRSGISRAFSRIGGLLPWALITTTVGIILRGLKDRAGVLGDFVINLIGAAWDVVTFLTVPAIVIDRLGAVEGMKRSVSLLRLTWGENIVAQVGFGLLGFLLQLPIVVLVGVSAYLGVAALGIIIGLAWFATVSVVIATLSAIFQTALYMYATTGVQPPGFEAARLDKSFAPK